MTDANLTPIDLRSHPKGRLVASTIAPDNTRLVTFEFTGDEWEKFGASIDPTRNEAVYPKLHYLIPDETTNTVTVTDPGLIESARKEADERRFAQMSKEERREARRKALNRIPSLVSEDESRLP